MDRYYHDVMRDAMRRCILDEGMRLGMVGRNHKNVFGLNGRLTLMGGERYTPMPEGFTYEDVVSRPDRSIPEDGDHPYSKQMKGVNVGYAFSVKYTFNGRKTAHHFILEYLGIRSFQGQTFDIRTHEIVDKFTSCEEES